MKTTSGEILTWTCTRCKRVGVAVHIASDPEPAATRVAMSHAYQSRGTCGGRVGIEITHTPRALEQRIEG